MAPLDDIRDSILRGMIWQFATTNALRYKNAGFTVHFLSLSLHPFGDWSKEVIAQALEGCEKEGWLKKDKYGSYSLEKAK